MSIEINKNIMSHFQLVGEFHDVYGHPINTNPCILEPGLILFRIQLIQEELNELKNAFDNRDIIEIFDALCDISYVTYGAGHCFGINLDELMLKEKMSIKFDSELYMDTEKVFEIYINKIGLIDKAVRDFCESIDTRDFDIIGHSLVKILQVVYDLGHEMGGNMDLMFREVHRSNMTKVCLNIEDANESLEFYKKDGRYKNPGIKTKGQYFIVFNELEKNVTKILKNHKWEKPNLKQFIMV